ncbi:MAG: Adenine DNA glycosylase [Candidatus Omnitrophica bacterium]|nr:Adenine DNA glycosylase [Candidatus Omnitrophota bacterium]
MTLQRSLLDWFARHARPLPWRRHYRPYEVWISEIMLQQTQMDTVLPYFERWMRAFPTVRDLARAPQSRVLELWQGLGYYSRARNLHHSARLIVERHGGEFPRDHEAIRSLKGVGPYTAGAISSIAFGEDRPIVDGNVIRVLARLYAMDAEPDRSEGSAWWRLQSSLIPPGQARLFNQAMMELGALVCLPKSPLCADCPVRSHCRAYQEGRVDELPRPRQRRATERVTAACIAWVKDGRVLVRRRPEGGIFGGLWELPEWKLARGSHLEPSRALAALRRHVGDSVDLSPAGVVRRSYTHHQERLHVYTAAGSGPSRDPDGWTVRRVPLSSPGVPLSAAYTRAIERIAASARPAERSRGRTQKA